MYVPALKPSTNGTMSVYLNRIWVYQLSRRFDTIAAAEADMYDKWDTTTMTSYASRQFMNSGIVGPGQFVNTNYAADYQAFRNSGAIEMMCWSGSEWYPSYYGRSYEIGFGYWGFFDTGCESDLESINPTGTSTLGYALVNRELIRNMHAGVDIKLLNRVNRQRLDLAESMSGVNQTVTMIAQRTSQLLFAWKAVKKGDLLRAIRILGLNRQAMKFKSAASAWLELQYGWMPLLNDIHSGVQLIHEVFEPEKYPAPFSATAKSEGDLWVPEPRLQTGDWSVTEAKAKASASVRSKITFAVDDPFWAYLNSLQVLNPAYVAWVNLPFSFLIDWLIPVGSMLSALTGPIGLRIVDGFTTTRAWGESNISVNGRNDQGYTVYQRGTASANHRVAYIRRAAITRWPLVSLHYRFPFSSNQRIANAIALLEVNKRRR